MYENQMQSRKWQLTINNPQDHGMTHDEIIDRTQKFNPDYVSPRVPWPFSAPRRHGVPGILV